MVWAFLGEQWLLKPGRQAVELLGAGHIMATEQGAVFQPLTAGLRQGQALVSISSLPGFCCV